jgi:hypothetical protein
MEAAAHIDDEPETVNGFFSRVQPQPFGTFTRHARNVAIDIFLTALGEGDKPTKAAGKAGVFPKQLELWASEPTDEGRIFALQWHHAEQAVLEEKERKLEDYAINGVWEYVTTKDGIATEYDPVKQKRVPLMVRKHDGAFKKFWAEANMPGKYGKRLALTDAASKARDVTDFTQEVPQIEPDEPGPAQPFL